MIYTCCENTIRREDVRKHATLNGIDFLEVLDREAPPGSPRQRTLFVHLFKPVSVAPPSTISTAISIKKVTILGGDRVKPIRILWIAQATAIPPGFMTAAEQAYVSLYLNPLAPLDRDKVLLVRTDSSGDYSDYTFRFIIDVDNLNAPVGFDPMLSEVDFSFKVECPTDFDCARPAECADERLAEPNIDYLAKDYASFRRLMLDRMAQIVPDWRERNPADLGVALVEMLAYVGDHLSYQQDAVATETYIGTARRRTSLRRHARFIDYAMHDGCNARVWVQVYISADCMLPARTQIFTRIANVPDVIAPSSSAYAQATLRDPVIFETMSSEDLFAAHGVMSFYTWSGERCCLPRGATRATLVGHFPKLKAGHVLMLEEVRSPTTGQTWDADREHRHPVNLIDVVAATDPLTSQDITEIRWHDDDALLFPLCISAVTDDVHGNKVLDPVTNPVSVAYGNIVLADHGRTIAGEQVGPVPDSHLFLLPETKGDNCIRPDKIAVPPRFRPVLRQGPLTQAAPRDLTSARASMTWPVAAALPAVDLDDGTKDSWKARRDLFSSTAEDKHFVAEIENDGVAALRFGDDQHGARPASGTQFSTTYRIGNGIDGNIGGETLGHVVILPTIIVSVRNPLPARGGTEPETMQEVRMRAPYAFRTQQRAVTPQDYAGVTERLPDVQDAACTFRWTGSWHTVFITVDRFRGLPVDAPFEEKVRAHVEPFRMAGYDLEIDAPHFVSLEIEMQVCVKPGYFRSEIKKSLAEIFSARVLADGSLGVFHPDNFSFGEPVYLSRLYAAAQSVPGVDSVTITRFQRQGVAETQSLETGFIALGGLEIARLDNSPDYPDRGKLALTFGGGM